MCTMYMWCLNAPNICGYADFTRKWESIHNDERSGRPSDVSTDKMRRMLLAIPECDQRFMICEIWNMLVDEQSIEVSYMTVQCVLAESCTKACTRWEPKQLTDKNKRVWVGTAKKFLAQHAFVSSQVMNGGFFTSPWHRKKTLKFGIKKVSQWWKMFVSTIQKKKSLYTVLRLLRRTVYRFPRRWE